MSGFGGGGFFGSGGKVQTTTAQTQTRAATGQAYADRGSQSISGLQLQDSASVQFVDEGAVSKAFDFVASLVPTLVDKSLQNSSDATAAAVGAFQSAQEHQGAVNADQLAKWGVVALIVLTLGVGYLGTRRK